MGSDVRNKEIYSAAIGGLEYGINWMLTAGNYGALKWCDPDTYPANCDGAPTDVTPGSGFRASPVYADLPPTPYNLADAELQTGNYGHTLTYQLLTDLEPIQFGDTDGDGVAEEIVNLCGGSRQFRGIASRW